MDTKRQTTEYDAVTRALRDSAGGTSMSEQVQRVALSDEATLRMTCKGKEDRPCGYAFEVPLTRLDLKSALAYEQRQLFRRCPLCDTSLVHEVPQLGGTPEERHPLTALARALDEFKAVQDRVGVEVIAAPTDEGGD